MSNITIDFTQYKGKVRTKAGHPARIVATDRKSGEDNKKDGLVYPIICLVEKNPGIEHTYSYDRNGKICATIGNHGLDLEPMADEEIKVTVNVRYSEMPDKQLLDKTFSVYAHAMIDGALVAASQAEACCGSDPSEIAMNLTFKREGTA